VPRIRSVKPEIHQDEEVGVLSDSAFRLFVGLITLADDYGRHKGGLRLLAAQVWPYRPEMIEEIEGLLVELDRADLIYRYEVAGKPYVGLSSWSEHQRIDNAGKPRVPEPNSDALGSSPRDSATGGDSRLDQGGDQGSRRGEEAAAKIATAPAKWQSVLGCLDRVAFSRGLPSPKPDAITLACETFAPAATDAEVEKFAHYWVDGPGERKPLSDVAWAWRNWLERTNARPSGAGKGSARNTVSADLAELEAEHAAAVAEEARAA
jgi:hypothetical protein